MTVGRVLAQASSIPLLERELLFAALLRKDRSYLLAHGEDVVQPRHVQAYLRLLLRRERGEPLAYLTGVQPFYGLDFLVYQHVLIPRPETEWLVEQAHTALHEHPEIRTIIDLGTGSGAIIIALWKSLPFNQRRLLSWCATDVSAPALTVARLNAKRHKTRIVRFLQADLLKPFMDRRNADSLPLIAPILLLANLPYLTTDDYRATAASGKKKFEPKIALEAGQDGLRYYRRLVAQIAKMHGLTFHCLWEIDPCHSKKLLTLVQKTFPKSRPCVHKDFYGLERYLTMDIER